MRISETSLCRALSSVHDAWTTRAANTKSTTPPAADGPSPENINLAIYEENPAFAFKPAVKTNG
jgi:hypothetical protein